MSTAAASSLSMLSLLVRPSTLWRRHSNLSDGQSAPHQWSGLRCARKL